MKDLDALLLFLMHERPDCAGMRLPKTLAEKRRLLRILMNLREPAPIPADLMAIQDKELQTQKMEKGPVSISSIPVISKYPRLRLWQGDITRLEVDAIVNAANSKLLGCFSPLHNCIDNAIHSAAGMQLREECASLMSEQNCDEAPGKARITRGYNLPVKYVIHTVGPIVQNNAPTEGDRRLLASCYTSCLELADKHDLKSVAFSCISTGVFGYPQREAAKLAIDSVLAYFAKNTLTSLETIIFDVFKDSDLEIYRRLLS